MECGFHGAFAGVESTLLAEIVKSTRVPILFQLNYLSFFPFHLIAILLSPPAGENVKSSEKNGGIIHLAFRQCRGHMRTSHPKFCIFLSISGSARLDRPMLEKNQFAESEFPFPE